MLFTVFFITSLLATTGLGSPMVDEVALPNGVQENQLEARQCATSSTCCFRG
ncbi:hypothetical protein MPH_03941, partial [Macrophomina phaseolina MS6]